jgi:hypothetical protein
MAVGVKADVEADMEADMKADMGERSGGLVVPE